MTKSVSQIALKDIAQSLPPILNNEVWIVRAVHLNTKETRKLNRKLNLHKINK
jgi:hypothetical protein